jgi:site-specific recombinase XerC
VRATVQVHRAWLEQKGYSPSTLNQRLAAIRKLAREAALNGVLAADFAAGIEQTPGAKQRGAKAGNRLTRDEAASAHQPARFRDPEGKAYHAVLALLIGCALRRSEAVGLSVNDVQQRHGRWSSPISAANSAGFAPCRPRLVKTALDDWTEAPTSVRAATSARSMDRHENRGVDLRARWPHLRRATQRRGK